MPTQRPRMCLNRRQVLGGACAVAGAGVLAQALRTSRRAAAQPATPDLTAGFGTPVPYVPLPTVGGAPFTEPPVLRSEQGRLDVALTAQLGPTVIGGREVISMTYNGQAPAPTLRLRPGETLGVTLTNQLDQPTNFHTHGLHVWPTGASDNVIREIVPQSTDAIVMDIPSNHNPGTFWYHGHKHGANAVQFYSGMTGFLIIEGDVDEVPEIAAAKERVLMFQEFGLNNAGEVPEPADNPMGPPDVIPFTESYLAINGTVNPIIRMQPGEVQRWRLANGTLGQFLNLSLEGHELHQIAIDGVTFDSVRAVNGFTLAPGNRTDFLIQAGAAGEYQLTAPVGGGMGMPPEDMVLATVIVEGDALDMALPTDLPTPDYILPDTTNETPDDYRASTLSIEPMNINGFHIDGASFQHDCVNHILQRGDLVEWRVENTSGGSHPFHIHTNAFQVIEENDQPLATPEWRDVIEVPGMGSITFRMRVDDFV
ncbi:MAG: multicopper oxidase family protein, partial [Thermomicrobiales bacterium]|nr:multicopper oxidase family protein [Thermomicrobiales bacterium]